MKKNKLKILFLGHTSKSYDGHSIKIDRSDLTRRMSCLETWVPEVEYQGHEVVFFEGSSDIIKYDPNNRLLSLPIDGSYDYNPPRIDPPKSLMLQRLVLAIEWALKNKEFDYIFRTDDGSYINFFILEKIYNEIEEFDIISNGFQGGGGIFFSKNLCKKIIEADKKNAICNLHHIEDIAIYRFINSLEDKIKIKNLNLFSHQYILGENFFTIHYTNGKRMYFTDFTLKRYFEESEKNKRKVILNYPIHNVVYLVDHYPNTWYCEGGTTPIWYSYTTNHNNWEHYGKLIRSNFEPLSINPFGKGSMKQLLFYKTVFDIEKEHERDTLLSYITTIRSDGELMFFLEEESNLSKNMITLLQQINLKIQTANINIRNIINSNEIISENGILIKITKE